MNAASVIAAVCPELSGSPSLQIYLETALKATDRRFFGSRYEEAVAFRAAHLFTVFNNSAGSSSAAALQELGGGAPAASVSEGKLSVSFAQSGGTAAELGSTKYGRMLAGLIKSRPAMGVNCAGGFDGKPAGI